MTDGTDIVLDMSNHQVSFTLRQWLMDRVQTFTNDILDTCGMSRDLVASPLTWQEPVYGDQEQSCIKVSLKILGEGSVVDIL